ncbi:hypothetical protein YPPY66_0083 [Yersinia pestis PY-66]|uniref:Uncharacterized protein n=2 Tax=Yersinia pestis TaxID=632 RepID=A0AB72ZQ06_YERPE|nr:hypothetical protein YPIP275_3031 [Yersinia pestis biovar Orientalis str. IP275]EDR43951.1 hypothetical protein YpE1979001_0323 [Yersinia pestis biovar Antiqua str. E1979001]EDR52361.1 hypothetical protein YpB42003004_1346 [Yersinia pestis biovar Antiqua str. B42003004]EDR60812.1 hypothetical protein YpUG050454_3290 [Yersinia pestis biovar Antiqua str. UG05-0454]EEO90404.1 hypothetical protein YPS_2407 [Yersinia pestis Pestoides A]EIQ88844.1 hypothetical protein YPPY01_2236 [Yersinia pestis
MSIIRYSGRILVECYTQPVPSSANQLIILKPVNYLKIG